MNYSPLLIGSLVIPKPLIQGGMAVRISTAELAAAVSNEGGLGIIGASGMSEDELREEIRRAKSLTDKPFGVNIMAAISNFSELLKVAVEENVGAVFVGAGFSRDFIKICKENGVAAVPIVSSVKAAVLSERLGADAVVLEAGGAGGHLGTLEPLFSLLEDVSASVKIPVIAAGGLITREEIEKAFKMGAKGVQLGTIFAASNESNAHQNFKEAYLSARNIKHCIIESPAGLPGRALNNEFVKKVVLGDEKHNPKFIKACIKCLKKCKKTFCILDALICAQKGYIDEGLIFVGEKVGEVKKIKSVSEIFKELGF
jgi:NAD(P)H-dependent flavin oxidoreductase YrpB (nitropropane dioxygenase family)